MIDIPVIVITSDRNICDNYLMRRRRAIIAAAIARIKEQQLQKRAEEFYKIHKEIEESID